MANHYRNSLILIALSTLCLGSCTKESWYHGAQSAKEAHCLKEPVSQYEECMKQSDESYDEYSRAREEVMKQKQ